MGKQRSRTNQWTNVVQQKVAQLYYMLSEYIIVHMGGEPLLDEDVRVSNHIITVLSTELVPLSSIPLPTYVRMGECGAMACL